MDPTKKPTEKKRPPPKLTVCTGASRASAGGSSCPGEAAPRHVFVARTAKTTTKETVENCLKYLTNIKGTAECVTPAERRETAHSLSWRVAVPAEKIDQCLNPSSWCTGWAVKEYFFRSNKGPRKEAAAWTPPVNGARAEPRSSQDLS